MVIGLEVFRDHFKDFSNCYAIIGGTACSIALAEFGDLEFRSTKDFDVVICTEKKDPLFAKAFKEFIKQGKYATKKHHNGKNILYRFDTKQPDFPVTIEIFSKVPDILRFEQKGHLTPLSLDGTESLSAICLDDDHYDFIQKGKKEISGVSCLGPEHLIPLKGFAWLKLNELNNFTKNIQSKDIKKHLKDINVLFKIVNPNVQITLSQKMKGELNLYLEKSKPNDDLDLEMFKKYYHLT